MQNWVTKDWSGEKVVVSIIGKRVKWEIKEEHRIKQEQIILQKMHITDKKFDETKS